MDGYGRTTTTEWSFPRLNLSHENYGKQRQGWTRWALFVLGTMSTVSSLPGYPRVDTKTSLALRRLSSV